MAPEASQTSAGHGSSALAGAAFSGLGAVELVATGEGQQGQQKRALHGSRLNRFLLVVNLALVAGACEDDNWTDPPPAPTSVPPMIGHAPDGGVPAATPLSFDDAMKLGLAPTKPVVSRGVQRPATAQSSVELRQSRLDTWPMMGPCSDFGAPAGQGWVQAFRFGSPYSNAYPDGQPNNCRQVPPESHVPNLGPYTYPSGSTMNDRVRAFFSYVGYLRCLKVTFREHDWGGTTLTYQACNTTPNTYSYVWSGYLQQDAGYEIGITQMTVEWWAI
jgi:hypothetical protein